MVCSLKPIDYAQMSLPQFQNDASSLGVIFAQKELRKKEYKPNYENLRELVRNDREAAHLMHLLLWAVGQREDINFVFSRWIRETRESKGWTQEQLGQKARKSPDVISKWENWASVWERGAEDTAKFRKCQFTVSDIVLLIRVFQSK